MDGNLSLSQKEMKKQRFLKLVLIVSTVLLISFVLLLVHILRKQPTLNLRSQSKLPRKKISNRQFSKIKSKVSSGVRHGRMCKFSSIFKPNPLGELKDISDFNNSGSISSTMSLKMLQVSNDNDIECPKSTLSSCRSSNIKNASSVTKSKQSIFTNNSTPINSKCISNGFVMQSSVHDDHVSSKMMVDLGFVYQWGNPGVSGVLAQLVV
ncbi:hypothetical protein BLOT_015347 [Blomia tropicalis]|nr:hypothetical protein BLOT_015347 [Blomia tropicalis]